ncbi:hypothetical protein GCM10027320_22530 [Massilia solisilvae]
MLLGAAFGLAQAAPASHPFPWMSGAQLLRQLDHPANAAESAEAVAYLKGVMDATADREWCYSQAKPGTGLLQPALTDVLRTLEPAARQANAARLAVQAWQAKWPCTVGCCHV